MVCFIPIFHCSYSYNCNYYHCNLQNRLCHNLVFLGIGNVAVSLHLSGSRSLNDDVACSRLMENVITQFSSDFYTCMFVFNRFLYRKFLLL